NKPLLGIIENMSEFICPKCNEKHHIFGEGGGKQLAEQFNTELLGSIPIQPKLREQEDRGLTRPFESFRGIAKRIEEKLNEK
ncbi:MAG: P-loop NTPase, partial [Candidatus Hodarchaeota archaeon]